MLVSRKYNYVFFCNRKSASTSVENMLIPYSDLKFLGNAPFRHTSYLLYEAHILPYIKSLFGPDQNLEVIYVVREPISWLNSWYRFRLRPELRDPANPKHHNSTYNVDFIEFLNAYLEPTPPPYADVGNQTDMIKNSQGQIAADRIFLYDDIDAVTDYMSQKVGANLKVKQLNVSPGSQHESPLVQAIMDAKFKLFRHFQISKPQETAKRIDYNIPDELMQRLKAHIKEDFDLYFDNAKT